VSEQVMVWIEDRTVCIEKSALEALGFEDTSDCLSEGRLQLPCDPLLNPLWQ
jgi:hypothetical protein